MLWLWAKRDPGKCLLAMALTLMGWLAAVNTANDVMQAVVGSELFGTVHGAKASRETIGWMLAGLFGGRSARASPPSAPASLAKRQAPASLGTDCRRRAQCSAFCSIPPPWLDLVVLLFVPWQAAVSASIAYALARPR